MKSHAAIVDRYQDAFGKWHEPSRKARKKIVEALGDLSNDDSVSVLFAGQTVLLKQPAELVLEDGTVLNVRDRLPPDLPIGYHELRTGKKSTRLIVSPPDCYLPGSFRARGWALQLYAMRSKKSWGIGDLGDLESFARWARSKLKSDFLLLNPLGTASPILPQQPSPYYPGSRRYRNPLYIRIEDVPGAEMLKGSALEKLATVGHSLNEFRLINRDGVYRLKLVALEKIWMRFQTDPAFEKFCNEQGVGLQNFATFCAIAEQYGTGWSQWPSNCRRPDSSAVKQFATEHRDRLRFHKWLQWLLDIQLERAARRISLMQDLPVGFDPDGTDAWEWQPLLAKDISIGAPPDEYNTLGQNWGLPPFNPSRLRAAGYEPFRQTIRAALRHAGGLRIDHVMGLFRLFWIPTGFGPADGAYVQYRADELLAVLAVESERAKAVIIGEDLGTVEPEVREELYRRKILFYRLLWFESDPPEQFPVQALAAVTTHDLFTIAGLWTGRDLKAQQQIGLNPNVDGTKKILYTLCHRIRLNHSGAVNAAIVKTHRLLAKAPCQMLSATLDDALGVVERPNMPGTTTQWPNWSLALPCPLSGIFKNRTVKKVAKALNSHPKSSDHRKNFTNP